MEDENLQELAEVDIFAAQQRIREQNNPIKIETSHEVSKRFPIKNIPAEVIQEMENYREFSEVFDSFLTALKAQNEREKKQKVFTTEIEAKNWLAEYLPKKQEEFKEKPPQVVVPVIDVKGIVENVRNAISSKNKNYVDKSILYETFISWVLGIDTQHVKSDISIWVYSVPGLGKTTMVQIVNSFLKRNGNGFSYVDMTTINKSSEVDKYCTGLWCFDDVGIESVKNSFGNVIDNFQEIIQRRYSASKHGQRTIVISNLPLNKEIIAARYGERVADRCIEMFQQIGIGGESFRGLTI